MASAGQAGRHWPVGLCAIRSIAGLVSAAHENLTDAPPAASTIAEYTRRSFFVKG